jgi:hypothetical protein
MTSYDPPRTKSEEQTQKDTLIWSDGFAPGFAG